MDKLTEYLKYIALQDFKTYHYKTLLTLLDKPKTQSEIGNIIGVSKQNINKVIKNLEQGGYIELDRQEGRNKFLRVVTNVDRLKKIIEGQIKL